MEHKIISVDIDGSESVDGALSKLKGMMSQLPRSMFAVTGGITDHKWSNGEKQVLCIAVKPSEPLDYPIKKVDLPTGEYEMMYIIPAKDIIKVCADLWPFETGVPAKGVVYNDIHCDKEVKANELKVIRYNDRNLVVSKYYETYGGMSVDLTVDGEVLHDWKESNKRPAKKGKVHEPDQT